MTTERDEKPLTIDYSTLSKLLPSYDGNKRTLAYYIEGVENALDLIKNKDDISVACLIRNKLTGKAVEALSERPGTKSWSDIKTVLKSKFGEFRTQIQLTQELMQITRDSNSLDTFGDKIRILMTSLISLDPDKHMYYEQMALETFLDKLNPITAISAKLKHPINLDQAVTYAKQEEIKLKARRALQQNKPNTYKSNLNKGQNSGYSNKNQQQNRSKFVNNNPDSNKKKVFFNEANSDDENELEQSENPVDENHDENFQWDLEEIEKT